MDETVSSDEETVIVDPKDVQFDFVKCDGKEDLPFPGPLYTHGVYKYHKNWDNLSKKSGTGNLARYECVEHRRSGCPGKAGVQFLRREEMSDIRSGQSASCRPYFSLSDPIEDGG